MTSGFTADSHLPSSAEMATRQNTDYALRLLIAQRRLYTRAKRWLAARWFGMWIIGLAAPVVSLVWPSLTVVSGAVAGVWIFAGRTILNYAQASAVEKAAATQEQFDFYVFGLSSSSRRSALPQPEEIVTLAGPDDTIRRTAGKEELLDWYPIENVNANITTVAICQRSNAEYSSRLLRATLKAWLAVVLLWLITLVSFSIVNDLSLLEFFAGVVLPVLPALLDIAQYAIIIRHAAPQRTDLARSIADRLTSVNDKIAVSDLAVWQEQLHQLRCSTPDVPNLIYKIRRRVNERAMRAAASQLGKEAKRQDP